MVATVKVVCSDQLIIKACNTTNGSGGVKRWSNKVGFATLQSVRAKAVVGNPLNHNNSLFRNRDPYVPGCYKRGFNWKRGGNQHKNWIVLYNTCPHAYWVERGRGPSSGREVFTWSRRPDKKIVAKKGTKGFDGNPILYPTANFTAKRLGMRGGVTLQSIKAAVR